VPAAWGRRFVAGLLDAGLFGVPVLAVWWRLKPRPPAKLPSRRLRLTTEAAWAAYLLVPTVLSAGTPGELLLGLRVVERSSGRPVGWRRAAIRWAVAALPSALLRTLLRARATRRVEAVNSGKDEREAELARLADELAGDEEALERAALEVLKGAYPRSGCALPVLVTAGRVALTVAAVRDPWHRSIGDRVAGTVVVVHAASTRT
jgi:uncharacterized RDD family membrane protein YckC